MAAVEEEREEDGRYGKNDMPVRSVFGTSSIGGLIVADGHMAPL
jgi:hypothetical protein